LAQSAVGLTAVSTDRLPVPRGAGSLAGQFMPMSG